MKIEIGENKEAFEFVSYGLHQYNNEHGKSLYFKNRGDIPKPGRSYLGCYAIEGETILGGACFYIDCDWLYVQKMFIREEYRGKNIATQIFLELEKYASGKNLVGIDLSTWDFQAKGFYEKMGFEKSYEVKDRPRGHIDYGFIKYIK